MLERIAGVVAIGLCSPLAWSQGPSPGEEGALSSDTLESGARVPGFTFHSQGHEHAHHGSGSHRDQSPIGVMGGHMHGAGDWMISVRYMRMHMEGMQTDGHKLSNEEVFAQGFSVTPTEMDTDMLMLGAMYAPTDAFTVMLMVPYLWKSMDHVTMGGAEFTTDADGIGDLGLTGLYEVANHADQRVHLNLGLSVPTGSIDERGDTPMMADAKLAYPMQLGTGTFDLLPGITYLGQREAWSWGGQGIVRFHLGQNGEGYRHGNRIDATAWGARRFGGFNTSFRLKLAHFENFHGEDPELAGAKSVVPTADPQLRGGDRLDALIGLDWYEGEGALAGSRLAVEFGLPVYQDLDGPQLETDWVLTVGYQYSF